MWMMISFTDDELALLMSCAAEIAPADAMPFSGMSLPRSNVTRDRDRGRVINDVQRRFLDRSNPCNKWHDHVAHGFGPA